MSRNINLYDARFLKKRDWLAGRSVALLTLLAIFVVTLGAGAARWSLAQQELQAKNLAGHLQQARQGFGELTRLLSSRKPDQALIDDIAALQRDIDLARQTGNILQGMADGGQQAHLGDILKVLARSSVDGLWLTGLALADGGRNLEIRGRVLDQSLLPAYLRRLESEPIFRGRHFAALEMRGAQWEAPAAASTTVNRPARQETRRERWYVDFALHTTPPPDDAKGAGKAVQAVAMPAEQKLVGTRRQVGS